MKFERFRFPVVFNLLFATSAGAWTPGTYPSAPERMASSGFSVDTRSRNDVVAFWHGVHQASEGYAARINWTGNYRGNAGTVSAEFVADVERRLNYFRAMCGLDANARVNSGSKVVLTPGDAHSPAARTLKSEAAQEAALMLSRNYNASTGMNLALTHSPADSLTGWSEAAWNGSAKGNFAFGVYGPTAITEYMVEQYSKSSTTSVWNSSVGHRRWCLYPQATDFATGDQPGTSALQPPTNVFYVAQNLSELSETPAPDFVCYPSAGYFPAPLNSPFWSVSCQGADLSAASVRVTDASGAVVPVSSVIRNDDYGDPAIIWKVSGAAAATAVTADTTFRVQISGINKPGLASTFSYDVTLINPDQLTDAQELAGPSKIPAKKRVRFTLSPPAGSEAVQVVPACVKKTRWTEDAESASKARVIDGTDASYPLIVKPYTYSSFGNVAGTQSFHLTFPRAYDPLARGVPEQSFELDREILPGKKARLSFLYRRGFMTKTSSLAVELSADGGVTWRTLKTLTGVSDTTFSPSTLTQQVKLPRSKDPVRVRFRYFSTGGAIFTEEASPGYATGIFIDDITTVNCAWLQPAKPRTFPGGSRNFKFKAAKKGVVWHLRMRSQLGGKWFPPGPAKKVKITR